MSYVISAYFIFYVSIFIYSARLIIQCSFLVKNNEDKNIDRISRGECFVD